LSSVILSKSCLIEHINHYARYGPCNAAIGYVYGFDHDELSDDYLRNLINTENVDESIKTLHLNKVYHDAREISYLKYRDKLENLPAPWFYFWTCHLSVSTEQLKEAGLFDENYDGRWGVEDNDLGFRLHQNGVRISLLRKAQSIHYPHDKNKRERILEGLDNRKYFHQKFNCYPTKLFLECYKLGSTEYIDINDTILNNFINEPQ
jgi:GT2 family glycosyltransferase